MVILYIWVSPNQGIQGIIEYIHWVLVVYTDKCSGILKKNFNKLPLILAGDFIVNFADEKSQPLKTVLFEILHLSI